MNTFQMTAMVFALSITLSGAVPTAPDAKPDDAGALLVQTLQVEIQKQQHEIDKIVAANVVASGLIRDMAVAAMTDDAIMDLVNQNGFQVKGSNKKAVSIPANPIPPVVIPEPPAIAADTTTMNLTPATQEAVNQLRAQWKANAKKLETGAHVVSKLEMFERLLLDLSKTDPGARAIVDKYHLEENTTTPSK